MKKIITYFLVLGFYLLNAQNSFLTRLRIDKIDSTMQVSNSDTSYIFKAIILTHVINGVNSFSLSCKSFNTQNSTWITDKDTSYTWSGINTSNNNSQNYNAFKQNDNIVEIILGRLYPINRRKFIFQVNSNNEVFNKEFDY